MNPLSNKSAMRPVQPAAVDHGKTDDEQSVHNRVFLGQFLYTKKPASVLENPHLSKDQREAIGNQQQLQQKAFRKFQKSLRELRGQAPHLNAYIEHILKDIWDINQAGSQFTKATLDLASCKQDIKFIRRQKLNLSNAQLTAIGIGEFLDVMASDRASLEKALIHDVPQTPESASSAELFQCLEAMNSFVSAYRQTLPPLVEPYDLRPPVDAAKREQLLGNPGKSVLVFCQQWMQARKTNRALLKRPGCTPAIHQLVQDILAAQARPRSILRAPDARSTAKRVRWEGSDEATAISAQSAPAALPHRRSADHATTETTIHAASTPASVRPRTTKPRNPRARQTTAGQTAEPAPAPASARKETLAREKT